MCGSELEKRKMAVLQKEEKISVERHKREKERGVGKLWHRVSIRQKPLWSLDWGVRSTEYLSVIFFSKQSLELKL